MFNWFLLLIAYLPFQVALNVGSGIDLASVRVLILLLFAAWFLKRGWSGLKIIFSRDWATVFLWLFLFSALFSVFGAENKIWALRKFLFFVSVFPLYFLTLDLVSGSLEKKFRKISKILLIGAGLMALIGLFQFLSQFVFGLDNLVDFWAFYLLPLFSGFNYGAMILAYPSWLVNINGATLMRAFSLFSDPHMFSMYLGMVVPLIIIFNKGVGQCAFGGVGGASGHGSLSKPALDGLRQGERAEPTSKFSSLGEICAPQKHLPNSFGQINLIALILYFLLFISLLLSFSRGAYLAIFATLLVLAWLVWRYLNAKKLALIFLLSLLVFFIPQTPFSERFFASFDLREGSNLGRLEMWQKSGELGWERFWFGFGLGNYSLALKSNLGYRSPATAHNLYLDIFSEMGILALVVWLALVFGAIWQLNKKLVRAKPEQKPILIGLIGSLIYFSSHSFFETGLYQPVVLGLLMVILGLAAASIKTLKNVY